LSGYSGSEKGHKENREILREEQKNKTRTRIFNIEARDKLRLPFRKIERRPIRLSQQNHKWNKYQMGDKEQISKDMNRKKIVGAEKTKREQQDCQANLIGNALRNAPGTTKNRVLRIPAPTCS
jgi:hypothetical protein